MVPSRSKLVVAALFTVCLLAAPAAWASITRVSGPTIVFGESRLFVKFDVAFDSVNNVYLVVWGTQATGPVNGLFLNRAGAPISGIFAVSDGPQQSGWARVAYSPQANRFLVAYTKILGPGVHQRTGKFVSWSNGPNMPWPEVPIDALGGNPGTDSGVAWSAPAGKFLVTWWKPNGAYPASWISSVDPATNIASAPLMLTDPADAQSDPEITCDAASNRCLAVGWSWGVTNGNLNSVWGRLIEASSGTPIGNSFIIDGSPLESEPNVGFAAGQFVVVFVRNFSSVWSKPVSPAGVVGTAQLVKQTAGEASVDGGGFGTIGIAGNPGTATLALTMLTWSSYSAVQELDGNGTAIAGSYDIIPNPGPNYNNRSKETAAAADPGGAFLVMDNDRFLAGRVSRYTVGATQPPPPPPPPPPATPDTRLYVDTPQNSATVAGRLSISGWALDLNSASGTGVDAIHAYAFPITGGQIFLGSAAFTQRLDVASYFGNTRFNNSGFSLTASLQPGIYTVGVYARSTVSGQFGTVWTVQIRVTPPSNPPMSIDQPRPDWPSVPTSFWIRGWALDASSFIGPGIDAIHAWAYPVLPTGYGTPIFAGATSIGTYRPDVAAVFGNAEFATAGYEMVVTLPPGVYDVVVYARSWLAGSFNNWRVVRVTTQ